MKVVFALLAMLLFISEQQMLAQNTAPIVSQKGNKTFVSVPVTVSDRDGRYIPNLKKEDFTLFQDGIEQKISFFGTYEEPLNVALLIDTSESTRSSLREIKDAAEDFIELLNPKDRALIATFDSEVKILNELTFDRKSAKNSLEQIISAERPGSVLLKAVQQLSKNSFSNAEGRKVIILLSDGKDSGSQLTKTEILNQLEESDVMIYPIFYQTGNGFNKLTVDSTGKPIETAKESAKESAKQEKQKPPKKKKGYSIVIPARSDVFTDQEIKLINKVADIEAVNVLKEMSDTTAGRFYQSDAQNLKNVFKKISGELREQYRIGFYTKDAPNSAVHNITVKVNRPEAVVRARTTIRENQL